MGGPMADVVKRVKDLGMKFGIWIEPEMVSEKSKPVQGAPVMLVTLEESLSWEEASSIWTSQEKRL